MSTLAQIEQAVESLPRKQQESLLRRLLARLGSGPSCYDLSRELFEEQGRLGASGARASFLPQGRKPASASPRASAFR